MHHDLGIAGYTQHCQIVQRQETKMRLSSYTLVLCIQNILSLEAKLSNNSPQVGKRIIQLTQNLDKGSVIETKSIKLVNVVDFGNLSD